MEYDSFTLAYIEAALWSSVDDDDEPLDKNYTLADIPEETLATRTDGAFALAGIGEGRSPDPEPSPASGGGS